MSTELISAALGGILSLVVLGAAPIPVGGVHLPLTEGVVIIWCTPGAAVALGRQLTKKEVKVRPLIGEVILGMAAALAAGFYLMRNDSPENTVQVWDIGLYAIGGGGIGSTLFAVGEMVFSALMKKKFKLEDRTDD